MAASDNEIVVEDADAPAPDSPPVVGTRSVNIVVYVLLIALAALLAYDNWRTGAGWAPEGPQAGYFPFYLSLMLAGASLFGLVSALVVRTADEVFVTRDQLRRVHGCDERRVLAIEARPGAAHREVERVEPETIGEQIGEWALHEAAIGLRRSNAGEE